MSISIPGLGLKRRANDERLSATEHLNGVA